MLIRCYSHLPEMRSLFSLSLLCFFLADVRDGLGPFFGVYLQSCGWSADSIGYVMTAGSLAGLFVSTFAAALADQTRHKRAYLFLCIVLIVALFGLVLFVAFRRKMSSMEKE